MKIDIFALRDEKSKYFVKTFPERDVANVIRDFSQAVFNADSLVGKFPADYAVYKLAEFDDTKGDFKNYTPVEVVIRGSEIIANPEMYLPSQTWKQIQQEIKQNGQNSKIQNPIQR